MLEEENIKRIEKVEKMIDENGVFIKTGSSLNMGILEDDYEDIKDEIKWILNYAKKQTEKVKMLEDAFDRKTRVHDKVNKDYVELRNNMDNLK